MNKGLIISVLLLISFNCFAQFENETHVFWQPNNKLSFDMFKGTPSDSSYIQRLKDLNIYHQIATGFWSALDVPKTKRGWKKGMVEKYYLAIYQTTKRLERQARMVLLCHRIYRLIPLSIFNYHHACLLRTIIYLKYSEQIIFI